MNLTKLNKIKFYGALLLLLSITVAMAQEKGNAPLLKKFEQIRGKDSIENYARQLIGIAQKKHDPLFEAQVLYAQAFKVYTNGDEIQALSLAYRANKLSSIKDPYTYTRSATMIATLLGRRGKNPEAINAAFDILRKTDAYGWRAEGLGCLICIGDLYRPIGDPNKGLPYAMHAYKDAQVLKDTAMYISSLSLLSAIYSYWTIATPARTDTAVRYLETVFTQPYVNKLSPYYKATYLSSMGRLYRMQEKFDKAKAVLLESIEIAKKENFVAVWKHSLNELMTGETDQGHYQEAIVYANQVLKVQSDAQSNRIQMRDIYLQLSRAYEGLHDYKRALEYELKRDDIRDSLVNDEKDRVATELAEKYKADRRLIIADDREHEARLQRNYIIVITIILLLVGIAAYRWFANKSKREKALMNERHRQLASMDAMKTRFFANISHELRTPLTLIMGPTEQLLSKPGADQQQQSYLQAVFRNSKKLLSLVNELLDLGKIEAGTLSVKLKPVDLAWFVNVIYQGFASAAAYKNITYTLANHIEAQTFVQLDADKFEKIANNLVSNAIKFTPPRGTVNIIAAINEGMIEFTVTDSGKGIHPSDLPLIFDRYYQGRHGETSAEGGTGIGLAIAREFSELMGGRITVSSTWGSGSTFKAAIPKIPVTTGFPMEYPQAIVEADAGTTSGEGEKLVMLVEDHHEMAQYISSIIKPFYRVVTAYNGREALDMLSTMQGLPDLIISDVMMPEMDGFTLLHHLKHDAALCRIPVIILTALGDHQNKLKALNTGVDDYLTKPFISSELIARTANLIGNAAERFSFSIQDEQEFAELTSAELNAIENESPKTAPFVSPADLHWLAELEAMVRKHIGKTDLNIATLGYDMAISERQLFRRIKTVTGLTPNKYIRAIRLQIAREAIESGRYRTISEISYIAGFDTPAYFSKLFKEHYGRDVNELL